MVFAVASVTGCIPPAKSDPSLAGDPLWAILKVSPKSAKMSEIAEKALANEYLMEESKFDRSLIACDSYSKQNRVIWHVYGVDQRIRENNFTYVFLAEKDGSIVCVETRHLYPSL